MKTSKIADKIIVSMCKEFTETGNNFTCCEMLIEHFPDEQPHMIYAAIRMLDCDGLINVLYADDEPSEITLNVMAIQQSDESTLIKKGYSFLKEVRSWL